ncbi:MAG: NAD kinase [Pseudomonadota bacterium]
MTRIQNLCVLGSDAPEAQTAVRRLRHRYGHVAAEKSDVIVALGGDGFMLQTLHSHMDLATPVYGMNRGSVGFLMNDYDEEGLEERLYQARQAVINPLKMVATDQVGKTHEALAINEVSLFRQKYQAAKIRIVVDGTEQLGELVCDGVLVATPAGSTAYNLSAHGPILPIRSRLMALTPISPFRPRRWRGAILDWDTRLDFEIQETEKRPVAATADHVEVRGVQTVSVQAASEIEMKLLYDPGRGLEERLLQEQFTV